MTSIARIDSRGLRLFLAAAFLVLVFFSSCSKEDGTSPIENPTELTVNEDAAQSVASAVSEDNGGVTDQMNDLMDVAQSGGFDVMSKTGTVHAEYDSVNGLWNVTVIRERGLPTGTHYRYFERNYQVQFLNSSGEPQKRWLWEGDTATTINFDIISGEGIAITPHLSHRLKELNGSFVATDVNKEIITVNGTYHRSAEDTMLTRNAERTHDHTLDVTLTDIKGPRGLRRDRSKIVSGMVTGTYYAFITWIRGDAYREREVTKDISVTFGDGEARINVDGETYRSDVATGELRD